MTELLHFKSRVTKIDSWRPLDKIVKGLLKHICLPNHPNNMVALELIIYLYVLVKFSIYFSFT